MSALLSVVGSASASEAPRLTITNRQDQYWLTWPGWATNWVLDASPHLQPPVPWMRLAPAVSQTDTTSCSAQISVKDGQRFFRLRRVVPTAASALTGHWSLDEGTGPTSDNASDPETPMVLSHAAWGAGRIGPGALRFNGAAPGADGTQAWISNANYRVLPRSGDPFSVSFWFSPEAVSTGWQGIVGTDADGRQGWHLALHTPGPGTNLLIVQGAAEAHSLSLTGRTLLLPGQWHQLTLTHDGTQGSLYLDRVRLARGTGPILVSDGPLCFGAGVGSFDSFLGSLDEVRTFTNCLTAEQVALTGYWPLDEGEGTVAADFGIQARDARVTGASPWAPGHANSGIDLSAGQVVIGNDDFTVLPGSGGPFSLSFWLCPYSLAGAWRGLMSCGAGSSGWQLAVGGGSPDGSAVRFSSTECGGTLELSAPLPLSPGVWTKLDLTYNGGIATIYVDGRQAQAGHGAIRGSRQPLVLGAVSGLTPFDGALDDLKIYGRERDSAEIGPIAHTMWETVFRNTTTNLLLQGAGPEDKPLVYAIVPLIAATNGTVHQDAGSPIVAYQAGGQKGPDAFTYTVSDGEFTSAPAIVTVSVVEPHWLSPNGGLVEPLDGTSPAQAWAAGAASALDAIWQTNNFYDCFYYAPGEYQTRGWKFEERSTANPGCKHLGAGPDQTTLRLVDIWQSLSEEMIFASRLSYTACDQFEVHHMRLDCNATNLPKYVRGEPIWLRLPLARQALVHRVTLHWADRTFLSHVPWRVGRAAEFSLCARRFGTNSFVTNCTHGTSAGPVDVLSVEAEADELVLELERRAAGIDFYGLAEIEVSGGTVSLPSATTPGGEASRLDAEYSVFAAVDGDPHSAWASGPEAQAHLFLPLAPGTAVTQLNLDWNCRVVPWVGRLGPAAGFLIRARAEETGAYEDVPYVRHGRQADGRETVTFGGADATNAIRTDSVLLVLTNREAGVDYYSLGEITLQNGWELVPLRLPAARTTLNWDAHYTVFRAFDLEAATEWASGTQGMVGALNVHGNNLKLSRLKVTGFGTTALRECFPVIMPFAGRARYGNVLVEDCVFLDPAPRNVDGLSALTVAALRPATVTNAIIRRCTVAGVKSQFAYSHGIVGNQVENCRVEDCQIGTYFEPNPGIADDIGPVLLRSNQYVNVDSGMFMLSYPSARFDSLTCLNNEVILRGGSGSGFSACDVCAPGPSGTITNFTALNNLVRYADWAPRPGSADLGLLYSDMRQAVFGNNVIALGNPSALRVRQFPAGLIPPEQPPEDCDHPVAPPTDPPSYPPRLDPIQPDYRRAWFNNRDLWGALLEVRFSNHGIDGLASQQQWPE